MRVEPTEHPEVLVLVPPIFADSRGSFTETFNVRTFARETGLNVTFVQDNLSISEQWVLRGLHYQIEQAQGKLVRAVTGKIFDVAVDIRRGSDRFGQWVARELDAQSGRQLWVPAGFAHGFLCIDGPATVTYKTTDYYAPQFERTLCWNDAELNVAWPASRAPRLSDKDAEGNTLATAELFP
ncbi:MAG: dTDP-4-dehydrorhamnose 3,5-epimerase [Chromatiales bacterium]|jgi:dTDP-4-dehydrorhamnose 3,5-epimerase|nr:dTDP-4-dehydrorhamnose 3,5-epimerase [Chromatiales bacterium]